MPDLIFAAVPKGMSLKMKKYYGKPVCEGTVTGTAFCYSRVSGKPDTVTITDISSEQNRFMLAKYIAVKELSLLYEKAKAEIGESAAMIFYIHQLMLEDETFSDSVIGRIEKKKINAETAVYEACAELAEVFKGLDDGYMRARRADVFDISERVIAILQSASQPYPKLTAPAVVIAKELSPSEILLPEKGMLKGLVLTKGTINSHASILARKMNIPTVCGVDFGKEPPHGGESVTIDAEKGEVIIE